MIYVGMSNQLDFLSSVRPLSSIQSAPATGLRSDHRLAANRRNALKSTGPRSRAGKYRSVLNLRSRSLLSEPLERELRARGEDPREFCCLQRDLAAIFHPHGVVISAALTMLARAWWRKARRIRQWVGTGSPQCRELDAEIEALLVVVVGQMRAHHEPWITRLTAVVGSPIGNPPEVRCQIEAQLRLFGGKPAAGRYRQERDGGGEKSQEEVEARLTRGMLEFLAEKVARSQQEAKQTRSG